MEGRWIGLVVILDDGDESVEGKEKKKEFFKTLIGIWYS